MITKERGRKDRVPHFSPLLREVGILTSIWKSYFVPSRPK